MLDEVTMHALRKQTFEKLKGMRLVILERALGSQSKALEFEREWQKLIDRRSAELMGKKAGKKGNKGGKQKEQNKQRKQAQEKKGKKK